jgi:anti-sigma factor RsiW
MRDARCLLASWLPGQRFAALAAHRESCLRCQAAAARDRSLQRALRGLAAELMPAPAGLHSAVMARLGRQDAADPRRNLAARAAARYTAAAGLATAAAVALAAGLARRHSRALS